MFLTKQSSYNKHCKENRIRMKKSLLLLTFTFFSIVGITNLAAQPPGPGGGGTVVPGCDSPGCIPIDGGISWLLLAGAAYGGKKLYKANKDKNAEA